VNLTGIKFRRYPDGCYAVIVGRRRGPCAHSRVLALIRYLNNGLCGWASTDR